MTVVVDVALCGGEEVLEEEVATVASDAVSIDCECDLWLC